MKTLRFLAVAAFIIMVGISCSNSGTKKAEQATKAEVTVTQGTLVVQGSCGMCKVRIEKTAKEVAGISTANWNSETKEFSFNYDADKTSPESISKEIAKVGHDTNLDQAPDDVYDALPDCCKYRTI